MNWRKRSRHSLLPNGEVVVHVNDERFCLREGTYLDSLMVVDFKPNLPLKGSVATLQEWSDMLG
jgi:hypothetical protein